MSQFTQINSSLEIQNSDKDIVISYKPRHEASVVVIGLAIITVLLSIPAFLNAYSIFQDFAEIDVVEAAVRLRLFFGYM